MEFWNKSYSRPNPVRRANCLSRLVYWWINGLFKTGYDRRLEPDDLFEVLPEDSAENLAKGLEQKWKEEVEDATRNKRKACLRKAVMRYFKTNLILAGFYCFFNEGMRTAQPVFLLYLLSYFNPNSPISKQEAYIYATGITITALIIIVLHQLFFFDVRRLGMQIRISVVGLIYRKVLQMTNATQNVISTGHIINLVSNDVQKLDESFVMFHFMWVAPLQMLVTVYLLWTMLGPSCLVGLALLLLTIPMQMSFGKVFGRLRRKTAQFTDERCRCMNEVISAMRVIKMYTWEQPFSKLVHELRRHEVLKIWKSSYIKAVNSALGFVSQNIISFMMFMTYVLTGNAISAGIVFTSISLLMVLQRSMTLHFPLAIQYHNESRVSLQRAQDFLEHEELGTDRVSNSNCDTRSADCGIIARDMTASWGNNGNGFETLRNINFEVTKSDLVIVVGAVGSGKSTLLMSLMGELPITKGNVHVKGTIGYVSQQPWIFSGTVKQNILFGQSFNPERYESVVRACALEKDLDLLPEGDLTLVGERGLSISGGQKARISLARAIYYHADIYLLDDPLSAVDAKVGRHLFDECLSGIIRHCPKVLVTHQLQFFKHADKIICLKEGSIVAQGSYNELLTSGVDFASLVMAKNHDDDADSAIDDDTELTPLHHGEVKLDPVKHSKPRRWSVRSSRSFSSVADILADLSNSVDGVGDVENLDTPNIAAEERPRGGIPFSLYGHYFAAGGRCLILILLVALFIAAQVAFTMCDWWLAHWSNKGTQHIALKMKSSMLNTSSHNTSVEETSVADLNTQYYLGVYGGLVIVALSLIIARSLLFFSVTVNSSKNLHDRMFDAILKTKIYFFDTNPLGRILNRFTKDIGFMDELLPATFIDFLQLAALCAAVVIVNVSSMPWVLIGALPLLVIFLVLRNYYLHTAREIKRLEAIGRSPVFSHFSATLMGLATIRAFGAQSLVTEGFNICQDQHTEAWFLFLCSSRWLAYRLDFLCLLFVAMSSFTPLFIAEQKALSAGEVGLAISYAILLTTTFQWCVRQSAEVENQMTSVERVISYTKLEPEGDWYGDMSDIPPSWPVHGLVTAEAMSFQYHPSLPRVLRNVYFCIRPKEKVGIVGRTGAGKSSLVSAILRLAEPKGIIRIDGVDISTLGLHDLRSKVSIIPQDPVLFSGPLRKNLDPFNEFLDCELWNSLQEVQLKDMIRALPGQLETRMAESGSNFSVGQRQLICLARALLRRNKILIIDEATANVDFATDSLIQQTLRSKFQHCTVLTIAHRLSTVMDSDRVMVLDSGRLREFDEPYELLQNKESWFYNLVEQTGRNSALQLKETARKAHVDRSKPKVEDSIPENERSRLHAYLPSAGCSALQVVTSL